MVDPVLAPTLDEAHPLRERPQVAALAAADELDPGSTTAMAMAVVLAVPLRRLTPHFFCHTILLDFTLVPLAT